MPSANVGSPIYSSHFETGSCEVTIVERTSYRSRTCPRSPERSGSESGAMSQSSITITSIRLSRANRLRRLPSARAWQDREIATERRCTKPNTRPGKRSRARAQPTNLLPTPARPNANTLSCFHIHRTPPLYRRADRLAENRVVQTPGR